MAHSAWRQLSLRLWQVIASPAGVVTHLGVYLVASTLLVLANVILDPGELWFWRPVLIWGALLAVHSLTPLIDRYFDRMRLAAALIIPLWTRIGFVSGGWALPTLRDAKLRLGLDSGQRAPAPEHITPWPAPTGTSPAAAPANTWPEQGPTWATSWPAPPAAATVQPPVRPTGSDTVLNGAQMADPEHPHWDDLEVAAASWLAQRSPDLEHHAPS